jgi:hypothetical protein
MDDEQQYSIVCAAIDHALSYAQPLPHNWIARRTFLHAGLAHRLGIPLQPDADGRPYAVVLPHHTRVTDDGTSYVDLSAPTVSARRRTFASQAYAIALEQKSMEEEPDAAWWESA